MLSAPSCRITVCYTLTNSGGTMQSYEIGKHDYIYFPTDKIKSYKDYHTDFAICREQVMQYQKQEAAALRKQILNAAAPLKAFNGFSTFKRCVLARQPDQHAASCRHRRFP